MARTPYSPRVELLDKLRGDLTDREFADLAVACSDQAGLAPYWQERLRAWLDEALATAEGRHGA